MGMWREHPGPQCAGAGRMPWQQDERAFVAVGALQLEGERGPPHKENSKV